MEYIPRYTQPFTLAEAIGLDVSIITDEIARLHNSLKHLRETQVMLREYQSAEASGTGDPEIQRALDENEVVIGSQTERISILKMALTEKGVLDSRHYEVPDTSPAANTGTTQRRNNTTPSQAAGPVNGYTEAGEEGEEGIHL